MKIGTIIEQRPDGTIIYLSYKGIVNVDSQKELQEVIEEEESFFKASK